MKYNHTIVIEDSSKVSFGGGQNISIQVSLILGQLGVCLLFVDFNSSSRYAERVGSTFPKSTMITLKNDCPIKLPSIGRKIWELLTVNYFARKNARLISKHITDKTIIYATTRRALITAYYAHLKYGIAYVYHAHLVENSSSLKYRLIKKALLKAQKIICVSQTVFNSIEDGVKVQLYNPAPETVFSKVDKNYAKKVVATIGSLIPIKGLNYFIDAAKQLENNGDVEFRIYGEGPLKTKLMSMSTDNVSFMGFCSDVMRELAEKIDIFVQPTIIQEALPTTIIEAKSVGIPIITTNIGGQAEIVDNNIDGILVPPKSGKAISDAIEKLCSNTEIYNSMSQQSKKSAELFDRVKFKQSIISLITQS